MFRQKYWWLTVVCLGLFRNFPGIFGNQQQHYMEVIKRMLVQCMQDQANPQVRSYKSCFWAVHFLIYMTAHFIFSNVSFRFVPWRLGLQRPLFYQTKATQHC